MERVGSEEAVRRRGGAAGGTAPDRRWAVRYVTHSMRLDKTSRPSMLIVAWLMEVPTTPPMI